MARDPVCGMEVDEMAAPAQYEYKGKTYYFCCQPCKEAFEKDPQKYLGAETAGMHGHAGHHM